jgi:hypothetical protein
VISRTRVVEQGRAGEHGAGEADHRVWRDAYRPGVAGGELHVKFTLDALVHEAPRAAEVDRLHEPLFAVPA